MDQEINNLLFQAEKSLERQYNPKIELRPRNFITEFLRFLNKKPRNRDYKFFFWPTASLAFALEIGYSKTQRKDLLNTQIAYYRYWAKKGSRIFFLDQIMNGYPLLYLYEITHEVWIEELLKKMYMYTECYPRTNTGSFPYRTEKPEIVLIDTLGMVCPFLSMYGRIFNCKEASNQSMILLNDFLQNGIDSQTGLPYHGFNSNTREKLGIIGWGRGVGWLSIGLIDTLANLDKPSRDFNFLLNYFKKFVDSIIKHQDDKGYFKWVLNAYEGHIDITPTVMIGYSIKRAIDLGFLNNNYQYYAEKSYQALLNSTKNGFVFDSSAECQGLGLYPQHYEWNLWGQGFGTAFALIMLK